MKFIILTPREYELVMRPVTGTGANASTLLDVQAILRPDGEIQIPPSLWGRIEQAAKFWKGGHEAAFKALLAASDRHP
jgi:hypothetical protein